MCVCVCVRACVWVWFMSLIVFRTSWTNLFSCSCCRTQQCWRHTCSLTRAARQEEHSATGLMAMVLRMPVQGNWMQPDICSFVGLCGECGACAIEQIWCAAIRVLTFSHSFNSMCGSEQMRSHFLRLRNTILPSNRFPLLFSPGTPPPFVSINSIFRKTCY